MVSGYTLRKKLMHSAKKLTFCLLAAGLCGMPLQLKAEKYYGVQLAAFNDIQSAEAGVESFREYGSPLYVQKVERATKELYCVCVGRFEYKVDAWMAQKTFKDQISLDCLVLGYESESSLPINQNSFSFSTPYTSDSVDRLDETEEPAVEQILSSSSTRTADDQYLLVMNARSSEVAIGSGDDFLKDFPTDSRRQEVALKIADLCIESGRYTDADGYLGLVSSQTTKDTSSDLSAEVELLQVKKTLKVSGFESAKADLERLAAGTATKSTESTKTQRRALALIGTDAPTNADGVPALEDYISKYPTGEELESVKMRLARRVLGRNDVTKARKLLDEVIESSDSSDEVGKAKVLKAYVTLHEGNKDEAARDFSRIANDLTLPAHHRLEGMQRNAHITHAQRDYRTSWMSYKQISEGAEDAVTRAEAKKQMVGLAHELVSCGVGSWDEVRSQCNELITDPTAPESIKATTELMLLETYFMDKDYTKSISETDEFLDNYKDYTREYGVALYVKGISLYKSGEKQAGKEVLKELYNTDLEEADRFGGKNPQSAAALWLAFIAKHEGQDSLIPEYLQFVVDHPTDKLLEGAKNIFGDLPEPSLDIAID